MTPRNIPRFFIKYSRAPGDDLVFSAFVRDLWKYYGGEVQILHTSRYADIWQNNPYCKKWTAEDGPLYGVRCIEIVPPDEVQILSEVQKHLRVTHYVAAFHEIFFRKTGLRIPVTLPRPDLHLTEEEKSRPLVEPPYWVIVPGGKTDMTNKIWEHTRYQEVVNKLREHGLRFVQEGAVRKDCVHPVLEGCTNLLGKTTVRQMIRNIYHADGVICGVSLPMHIAGALEKPCVVIGGGRESPCFEEYSNEWPNAFGTNCPPVRVPHRFLHTIGLLDCCLAAGCWLRRVVPLHDQKKSPSGSSMDKSLCHKPTDTPSRQIIPRCLDMIRPEHVVEAVLSYRREE